MNIQQCSFIKFDLIGINSLKDLQRPKNKSNKIPFQIKKKYKTLIKNIRKQVVKMGNPAVELSSEMKGGKNNHVFYARQNGVTIELGSLYNETNVALWVLKQITH